MKSTKIIVVHIKQLIKTSLFILLGLALITIIIYIFIPKGEKLSLYKPGTYKTQMMIDNDPIIISVIVSENKILAIEFDDLNEIKSVFYPLIKPTFEIIAKDIIKTQSIRNIKVQPQEAENSKLLIKTISIALNQAKIK